MMCSTGSTPSPHKSLNLVPISLATTGSDGWNAYLRRVQCPALLIRGQSSPLLSPEVARKMVEALPEAQTVDIANAAHTVNADNVEEFNRVAAAFLQA